MHSIIPLLLCCLVSLGCADNSPPSTALPADQVDRPLSHAEAPAEVPHATSPRFSVSTEILPGQLSMTVLYITDAETDQLHIYRALGGLDASFKSDPVLYRTFDLTSAGQKTLKQAE